MALTVVRVLAAALLVAPCSAGIGRGICNFSVIPIFPGFFVDPTCKPGDLGCLADGKNVQCRFCGGGAYENITCGASACTFVNQPYVPYYWDPTCKMGKLGCWADGVHAQCRFCGRYPYTSIDCPEYISAPPKGAACEFNETSVPKTPFYWEPACKDGMLGCLADGINVGCRYCGEGAYASVQCPRERRCSFPNQPSTPYYWEPECKNGMLGCLADGVNPECRFCAQRPFEDIPCRGYVLPDVCTWPKNQVPATPFFWDDTCEAGMLGCWADGLHAQCRFCGIGAYANVTCPSGVVGNLTRDFQLLELPATAGGPEGEAKGATQAQAVVEEASPQQPLDAVAKDLPATTTSAAASGREIDVNAAATLGRSAAVLLIGVGVVAARA